MAIKVTYTKMLDEIKPSLEALGNLVYKEDVPISHLLSIAENLEEIKSKEIVFWEIRNKIIESVCEKDEKGNIKTKETKEGVNAVVPKENHKIWESKFKELQQEEIEINLKPIKKQYLEGAKISPKELIGCLFLLE